MSYYLGEVQLRRKPMRSDCRIPRSRRRPHARGLGFPVPADMTQRSGLDGTDDSSLGLSFNIPGLTTSTFTMPTPPPGASPSTEPSIFDKAWQAWQNRPAALKAIKIKLKPQQLISQLPPGAAARTTALMQQYGFQPEYQGVPITPGMAGFGQFFAGVNWTPILIGAAALGGLFLLSKR